jgi:hypothetical protein
MRKLFGSALCLLAIGITSHANAQGYTVTDLGAGVQPDAINNQGLIAGLSTVPPLPGTSGFEEVSRRADSRDTHVTSTFLA